MYFAQGLPKIFNLGTVPNIKTSTATEIIDISYSQNYSYVATVTEGSISIWSGDQVKTSENS